MYSKKGSIRKKVKGGFLPFLAPMMSMMNPASMMEKMNPLSMLMGKGVVNPRYSYEGSGVVNPRYSYEGSGVVNPRSSYQGGNFLDLFNPVASPLAPWNWGKGQVGGKRKRAPSVRGQKVAHLMRTKGMTLPEASRHLKQMGQ